MDTIFIDMKADKLIFLMKKKQAMLFMLWFFYLFSVKSGNRKCQGSMSARLTVSN